MDHRSRIHEEEVVQKTSAVGVDMAGKMRESCLLL